MNEVPPSIPVSQAELLIFVMDGSGSMTERTTQDGREKADHLYDIVKETLETLSKSTKRESFRISFIYFSETPYVETIGNTKYFRVDEALQLLKKSTEVPGNNTAIADALRKANEIIDEFKNDISIPQRRYVTVFLFTDGLENIKTKEDVEEEAMRLRNRTDISVSLATISFGSDADEDLLKKIASQLNYLQRRVLEMEGLLNELPDPDRLFVQGHATGTITERKAKTIRNFVETLSLTKYGLEG
jgi:Mg-chelatase subunit ChlD